MSNVEGNVSMEGKPSFRELVGDIVQKIGLFPDRMLSDGKPISLFDAIENDMTAVYLPDDAPQDQVDIVRHLVFISDELHREHPDQEFITKTLEELKTYL